MIYFDAAATTKPHNKVLKVFIDASEKFYANPSALHSKGLESERSIRESAKTMAMLLGRSEEEIYFTSGATESNNLAISGLAKVRQRTHKHMIVGVGEHPSVTEVFKRLSSEGFEISWIKPDKNGIIIPEQILAHLRTDTALVSVMHVNNETGAINDIHSIGKTVKENSQAYFFSDGVQGFGKLPINLKFVDCYSFSGHKFGCIKGIGGLFLKSNVRIVPLILGGGQQRNIRPGTENPAAVKAIAKASEIAFNNIHENYKTVMAVRAKLLEITQMLNNTVINSPDDSSPYILNISFLGIKSEVLLHSLAEEDIFVSAGSACSSNKKEKEKNVLYSMGYEKGIYESAVRISFSPENTLDEAQKTVDIIRKKINFLSKYIRK